MVGGFRLMWDIFRNLGLDPLTGIGDFPDGMVVDSIIIRNLYNFVHNILKKVKEYSATL